MARITTILGMKYFPFLFQVLIVLSLATTAVAAEIGNAAMQAVGDEILFSYDLAGKGGEELVGLTVAVGGTRYPDKKLHLDGDVGMVKVGKGKKIRWKVRADFPTGLTEEPKWQLTVSPRQFRDPATGIEFLLVRGGCFPMGDGFGDGTPDEKPVHEVCLEPYYLGRYEVTQGEWRQVMGSNPSHYKGCGDRCPVESVSWKDVEAFVAACRKLNGKNYRFPSEAEWEFAARSGGKKQKWSGTGSEKKLKEYAVYAKDKPQRVGSRRPNALGFHDMSGNVSEWVLDYFSTTYYRSSPRLTPPGPENGITIVQRGGSWSSQANDLRATKRARGKEDTGSVAVGFRLALTP